MDRAAGDTSAPRQDLDAIFRFHDQRQFKATRGADRENLPFLVPFLAESGPAAFWLRDELLRHLSARTEVSSGLK